MMLTLPFLVEQKRIPVESRAEDKVVHIMSSAHVRPPYVGSSIECSNTVMRERVRAMVQELPRIVGCDTEDSTSPLLPHEGGTI